MIHAYSRGVPFRALLLATVYVGILLLGWVAILVAILGLAEPLFSLRERAGPGRQPPKTTERIMTRIGVTNMQVILLERIGRLGQMGDVVTVKDGFARNFLLPQGKALRATEANRKRFERDAPSSRRAISSSNPRRKPSPTSSTGKSFIVIRQAGDVGQLYGSVHTRDIADGRDRRRLLHRAPPGHARPPDQDARPARASRRAAWRGRAAYHVNVARSPTRLRARHAARM